MPYFDANPGETQRRRMAALGFARLAGPLASPLRGAIGDITTDLQSVDWGTVALCISQFPTGFRPWNFAMQTNGQRLSGLRNFRVARLSGPARLGRMQRLGRLGRLGDDGIPAGTRLLYNATFTPTENPLSPSFYNINSVIAAVAQNLDSQWGITVTSQQSSGAVFG